MTDAPNVPEEHSTLVGGSTASRRINCPRSIALEKLVPEDPGSSYAREGTALHEMMAIVIGEEKNPEDLLPFTFTREDHPVEGTWSVTVDEDLWYDLGEPALAAWDKFVDDIERDQSAEMTYVVETRCAMPGIDGAFGTSDIIWCCGNLSGVWDWKFGRNRVSAEDNDQLKFYARAAASTMPRLFATGDVPVTQFTQIDQTREVILSIMQPQCSDEPDEYIVTVGELEEFRHELIRAVTLAQAQGDKAPVARGKWCDYATCKAVCPLWAGRTVTLAEKMAALAERQDEVAQGDASTAQDDFVQLLPDLLDLAEAAEDWIATIRKTAYAALEEDRTVEGWRFGESTTNRRTWAGSDEDVLKMLKARRYKMDEVAPRKVITMPAAEKLLKKDGKKPIPDELVETQTTKKKALVRDDSSLPRPEMSSARASALGDKLADLAGEPEA